MDRVLKSGFEESRPRSAGFQRGFEAAEKEFHADEKADFRNPFPPSSDEYEGYEKAVYIFTQK